MTVDEQADETMLLHPRQPLREPAAGDAPTGDGGTGPADRAGSGESSGPTGTGTDGGVSGDGGGEVAGTPGDTSGAGAATEPTRRPVWARVLAAVLLAALGFAGSVSIRSNSGPAGATHASDADLVRVLDGLDAQEERLRGELAELERAKAARAGPGGSAASLDEARDRAGELAVLAGTAPVQGRGVEIVIADPRTSVDSAVLVDALQELRGAGAEAIEINGVRVVVSTYVLDNPGGGISVDGTTLTPPYRLAVIGDSHTLAQAVQIPGGVLDTVASREGASATVDSRNLIEIRALRPVPTPRYARPAG